MPTKNSAHAGGSMVESMRGSMPVASAGEIKGVLGTVSGNPSEGVSVPPSVASSPAASTPETTPEKQGGGASASGPGTIAGFFNQNGNAGGSNDSSSNGAGDTGDSSATETGMTPDQELLDLAEAAMGGESQPGSDDTIALPVGDDEGTTDAAPAASTAAGGSPLRPIIIIGIIIGIGVGLFWVFKHRKNLAKAAKDAVP